MLVFVDNGRKQVGVSNLQSFKVVQSVHIRNYCIPVPVVQYQMDVTQSVYQILELEGGPRLVDRISEADILSTGAVPLHLLAFSTLRMVGLIVYVEILVEPIKVSARSSVEFTTAFINASPLGFGESHQNRLLTQELLFLLAIS